MRPADALPMIEAALRGGGLTPHHRVHHAANPAYLDANYGGILIVWDRPVRHRHRAARGSALPLRVGEAATVEQSVRDQCA
jgi:hypothetical protein